MKRLAQFIATGLVAVVCCFSSVAPALAATNSASAGQALEIAPPILTLNANPGQTLKIKIQIRDIAHNSLVVTNEINDFVAAGEDGTPKILTKKQSANDPYTMKDWITPLPEFTLKQNQIYTLPVNIHVPASASPGGHYGVIRFTGVPPSSKGTSVSLSASVGALMLLTVSGNIQHKLSVQDFSVSKDKKTGTLFESTPLNFNVKLKNSGNIQEQPTGHVTIKNMFGKIVAGVNINLQSHNVLPGSTRAFIGPLDKTNLGNKKLFGLYHAYLAGAYGSSQKPLGYSASLSFWVIPWKLILGLIAFLIIGFFVLRRLIRKYNQAIINRAQGGPAKKPKKRK